MKISYFETGRYVSPPDLPREWPVPPAAYDPAIGADAFRGMVERVQFVERLGFDWISVSEHHYSPRILTPSPVVSAAWLAARVHSIKIALLGPIVPTSNPIRVAEEMAMLDTLAPGRIVIGLLRGTTNEYLSYDLNPSEARERTDEGMELILKAWNEPQPFGWQGRYFQYRTVSIWPRPQQPPAPTYILGTSAEAGAFAARHHCGLGVSYGNFESMGQATAYYRQQCAQYGWVPGPDDIVYRANMILGETDDAAEAALQRGLGRRAAQRRYHAQHRGGKAARQCRRRAADQLLRWPGPDRRANQALPRDDRRRRAGRVVAGSGRWRHRRDDGRAGAVRAQSPAAHPRHLTGADPWQTARPQLRSPKAS
jgi:alkanesulfonate monooxygenase SsuD/methylene tetrahydromethanopterin reductase-like flavin-dependent oxidoreductase (luciferase family)